MNDRVKESEETLDNKILNVKQKIEVIENEMGENIIKEVMQKFKSL